MKNGIILAAFMAALCASAETVKTATQPWVRAYVASNHVDITGKADSTNVYTKAETDAKIVELAPAPGDYSTVSNRAMSALQSHQSLWPAVEAATNYTDKVAKDFEEGMRNVQYANNSGHTDYAVYLYNEGASELYNATDLIRASTNAAEQVVREKSLGGIYDSELGVWWTPIMQNGALRYVATTNVNLSAGGNQ